MKSPAFRFFPADFWGSPDVQAMELHEVGAYLALLSTAWQAERHGYLPDDESRLRRWARMTMDQWRESRDCLLRKFPVVEDGWRANPRMVEEADRQADYSASQKSKAEKRWGNAAALPNECPGNAGAYAAALPVDAKVDAGAMPSVSVSKEQKQKHEPSALSLVGDTEPKQAVRKPGSFGDGDVESIWSLWPNKGGKRQGLVSIRQALKQRSTDGAADPVADLTARVRTWLAWHGRETAAGRFVPAIGHAQGWFGDKQRRYLDPAAEPPPETRLLLPDGTIITAAESEAQGWTVMRGDG